MTMKPARDALEQQPEVSCHLHCKRDAVLATRVPVAARAFLIPQHNKCWREQHRDNHAWTDGVEHVLIPLIMGHACCASS